MTSPGVEFRGNLGTLDADALRGWFFEGWPDPPTPEGHLLHLRGCESVELALDPATGDVVGFCSAIGDGATVAFISLLEVLLVPSGGTAKPASFFIGLKKVDGGKGPWKVFYWAPSYRPAVPDPG